MRIGIVLSKVPGYSETFFRSKIQYLTAQPGLEVIVFVDRMDTSVNWNWGQVVAGLSLSPKGFLDVAKNTTKVLKAVFMSPLRIVRFLNLNARAGRNWRLNMVSLFKSIHILPFHLDWIHFGFGTTALGREFVAEVLKAKMAVSFRGFDIAIYPLKNPDCYQFVWRMSDKIHVISDDLAHLVHEQGYPNTKPLIKITPAIDVKFFARKIEPQIIRNPVRFVTVARLHWKKGLEYTLEALALLKEKGIDFVYTLVGEGEEYERLIFAAHQLGVVQNLNYVGKLPPEEVVRILGEADIYIQYSIQEGFCNAVLEAQAMSLLCVVSDAEGLAENVLHGDTGWVVPKRKPQLLANQLTGILQQTPERLEKIRNQARDRVQNKFSVQEQCQSFLKFYEIQTSI